MYKQKGNRIELNVKRMNKTIIVKGWKIKHRPCVVKELSSVLFSAFTRMTFDFIILNQKILVKKYIIEN